MFARNFAVKYKPIKSNFVLLPENYRRLVSTCKTGCLLLHFLDYRSNQYKTVYVSWSATIQANNPFEEEEIGINAQLAELFGLKEGVNVSCSVIQNASPVRSMSISLSDEDYQVAECSLDRLQYDMLDQVSIVGRYQPIIIWLNKSIAVNATVDNLSPTFNYGRILNDTEISINRKMTPDFLRRKPKNATTDDSSESKITKRMSAIEKSETVDLSNMPHLRRNNSFIDSRKFLDTSETNGFGRRTSTSNNSNGGWSDTIYSDVTSKKPPTASPRSSIKKIKDNSENGKNLTNGESLLKRNSITSSASLSNIKAFNENNGRAESKEREFVPISNSLSTSNIKRVQEKSNKFLEQLSNQESPARKLLNSASASCLPKVLVSPTSPTETKQNHKLLLEDMKKALFRETHKRHFMKIKIVSDKKKLDKFMQINDIYISKNASSCININQIHKVRTKEEKEYHVRIKCNESLPFDTIEVHPVLAKVLNIEQGFRVELSETKLVCNCIESLEIIPYSNISENNFGLQIAKDIDEKFKKYVNANTKLVPLILNQNQIFKLDDYLLTIKIFPLSTHACCIDSEILREGIIDVMKRGEPHEFANLLRDENERRNKKTEIEKIVKLDKHQQIVDRFTNEIHSTTNDYRVMNVDQNNSIISGATHSGKKTICNEIKKNLEARNVNVIVFNCAQYKGRKVESIVKDMKIMMKECLQTAPSTYIIHNLDALCTQSHDDEQQSQENEYQQKLANNIRHVFEEFTHDYGNMISIVVTTSKMSNLSKNIFRSYGNYLFKNVVKIPNLEAFDRRELFKNFFHTSSHVKIDSSLDWDKFARITEGYNIGDICQFTDRAIFFAIKENYKSPLLTEDILRKSLNVSNKLCLEGIKTESIDSDDAQIDIKEEIPGMDNVIETLEEVLIWPTKFSKIFQNSPLRNQAGILLFGFPGSGKNFIVSQITKRWNLRLISIKGPELLAKYIGQSEENVRNLFEKAKSAKPCVLFFDEFESLAPRRGHDSTGVTDRVVNQLLTELDGVKSLEGVSIICATSRPDLIDPALLRSGRIDRLVECQLPNASERLDILKYLSKSLLIDSNVDFKVLASKMTTFTGADIKSVLTTANMNAIEEEIKKNNGRAIENVEIKQTHLEAAFQNTRASLTKQDIEKYQMLYDRFKNKKSVTVETPQRVSLA
ncbi:hypothetical protein PVAND_000781 [Polypedilum vanderplanki]|uniref:Peroxisomal ATPase PEX1 n=1 Tax=Polypedilum vanderplanki TaxID=319348 RepID=A0A9J6BM32_POLVA|nr:hypothetical protein PVAND_000781 [Polypedilum vanderplanki]